jgi:ribosomal protein L12E/L44/L45/RPP1/RPP2
MRKIKLTTTITITQEGKEILEKLSKKHGMSKSEIIETLIKNINDTDLEKILLIPRVKPILGNIIEIKLREEKENKIDLTETKPKEQKQEKKEEKKQEKKEEKKEEKKDEKIWIDLDTFFDDLK